MIVFDSSFLIAYHNRRDAHHVAAAGVMERFLAGEWGEALLPEYVFLEVTTVLAARVGLGEAVAAGRSLLDAREVEFTPCSDFFLDTFEVFRAQADGVLSFADAAIVAIARSRGTPYVATFDNDFTTVEGIVVIPEAAG